jgi:hypothetical protein
MSEMGIRLLWRNAAGQEVEASSSASIKDDVEFSAALLVNPVNDQEFKLDCAILAKKRRYQDWIFGDDYFAGD